MIPCESRPVLFITLLLGLAWAAVNPTAAVAQDCDGWEGGPVVPGVFKLVLPDGQDTLTCNGTASVLGEDSVYDDQALLKDFTEYGIGFPGPEFRLSGSGAIEFIATIQHAPITPPEDLSRLTRLEFQLAPHGTPTKVYRLIFNDPNDERISLRYVAMADYAIKAKPGVSLSGPSLNWAVFGPELSFISEALPQVKVTITVRRIRTDCSMWATVSGDVNDTFYGDVAYFMEGHVDPELMKILGQWIGEEANKDFEAFLEKELGPTGGDSDGAGGNHFTLTLQDFKIGRELPPPTGDDPAEDPVLGLLGVGDSGTNEALRQVVGILAGQFALGINVTDMTEGPRLERKVQVNEVRATVGARDEGDRIPFDVVDNAELNVFVMPESDAIYGTFSGDLSTRKSYALPGVKARQLQVHIEANFTALRGQTTCAKR